MRFWERVRGLGLGITAVVSLATLTSGCGDSFVPPPPPELSKVPRIGERNAPQVSITMVLGAQETDESAMWESVSRVEAGLERVAFEVVRPGPGEGARRQAELIRNAGSRPVSCLIVEPMDGEEVAEAINDVWAGGVPVVVVGQTVASRDSSKPLPVARFASLDEPLKKLATAIYREVCDHVQPPDSPAIIVRNTEVAGTGSTAVMDRIEVALMEAGAARVSRVDLSGGGGPTRTQILRQLAADPNLTVIVGVDAISTGAAMEIVHEGDADRPLSVAGCFSIDRQMASGALEVCIGIVDRNEARFARDTFRYALKRARGESVPDVLEVPIPYSERRGPARLPAMKRRQAG